MDRSAMTCLESTDSLVAGYRSELEGAESDRLLVHLESCESCRQEDAEVRSLASLLADRMPTLEPRPDAWNELRTAIDAEAVAAGNGRGRLLFAGFAAAVAAAACLLLFTLLPSSSPSPSMTVVAGEVTVNGASVETLELTEGALIATSMARLAVRSARDLDLVLAARLRHDGPGRFTLLEGRVLADVRPGDGTVSFGFPGGSAEVAGTMLQLTVHGRTTELAVIEGEVTMRTGQAPVRVVSGESATFTVGGTPSAPVKTDPWRVRDWCTAPTFLLRATPDVILLTLKNETVLPLVVLPFDPAVAAYSLKIESPTGTLAEMKLQEVMVAEGARRPGDPRDVSLEPGGSYVLRVDPRRLGLAPGAYRVRGVYHPYDLPAHAWRGVRETEPETLIVR